MIEKRIWSLSTTVRNPERLYSFFIELSKLEGKVWDDENQKNFQSLLIQKRLYVPTHNNLREDQIELLEDESLPISFEQAREIFDTKNYRDASMRGRASFAPINRIGLANIEDAIIDGKSKKVVAITHTGKLLLENKIDFSDCMFKSLLKLQYPNPLTSDFTEKMGYNIKPFVATLSFLLKTEEKFKKEKIKFAGITKTEFGLFVLTLCDSLDIDKNVNALFEFRNKIKDCTNKEKQLIVNKHIETNFDNINNKKNIKDYVDNVLRNFRMTGYIRVRGNGNYIDIERNREKQIKQIISSSGVAADKFENKRSYQEFLGNYETPEIPWENPTDLMKINDEVIERIKLLNEDSALMTQSIELSDTLDVMKLKIKKNREIHSILVNNKEFEYYFDKKEVLVEDIKNNDDSVELERLIAFGLKILIGNNDVVSNCPMGDDGFPTSHAPGKYPDIEITNKLFGIAEVTMLKGRNQFYAEGQPVLRHQADFSEKYNKDAFCIFIAPSIHRDTQNAFWTACKHEYEGKKRKIFPITIEQFCSILLKKSREDFCDYVNKVTSVSRVKNCAEWMELIGKDLK